jgi:hypothetical protein
MTLTGGGGPVTRAALLGTDNERACCFDRAVVNLRFHGAMNPGTNGRCFSLTVVYAEVSRDVR